MKYIAIIDSCFSMENDYVGGVVTESPSDIFKIVTRAIDEIGFAELPEHLGIVVNVMSELSYSEDLTCKMSDIARSCVETILSDRELANDMIPWRFWKEGYLLDMARQIKDVVQVEVQSGFGFQGNRLQTAFDVFNDPKDPETKKILNARYCSGRYRVLEDDDNLVVGFRIHDTLRINKNHNGMVLRPHKWLSGIFHELVHQFEHQMELVQKHKGRVDMPLCPSICDNDLEISEARGLLKIDKAFYAVAYDLYRATPSEKLALSTQAIFRDELQKGLLKLAR